MFFHSIKPFAQPPFTTLPAPVPAPISKCECELQLLICHFVIATMKRLYCLPCGSGYEPLPPPRPAAIAAPVWQDRTIASAKLRLLEYSAFMETQRERETVQI